MCSLWEVIGAGSGQSARHLWDADTSIVLSDLLEGTILGGRAEALRGRSVLIATRSQLTAALALVELDGVARRLVLCPPDLAAGHVPAVMARAAVDAILSDLDTSDFASCGVECFAPLSRGVMRADTQLPRDQATEWVLLTSGTTGIPKMVVHSLSGLTGAIGAGGERNPSPIWSTFYDIRRYGGLQVLLRALIDGGSLVLPGSHEALGDFLARAGAHGVTHISGTPSHWRRAPDEPGCPQDRPPICSALGRDRGSGNPR